MGSEHEVTDRLSVGPPGHLDRPLIADHSVYARAEVSYALKIKQVTNRPLTVRVGRYPESA